MDSTKCQFTLADCTLNPANEVCDQGDNCPAHNCDDETCGCLGPDGKLVDV